MIRDMTDTPPEIAKIIHDRLMACTPEERFMMGIRSFDAAREMVLASMPKDLSREEFRRQYYRRIYGEEPPF